MRAPDENNGSSPVESRGIVESRGEADPKTGAPDLVFWRRVATLVILCPTLAAILYVGFELAGRFEGKIQPEIFLAAQLSQCLPEPREQFFYFCAVLLPAGMFWWMSRRGQPGLRVRPAPVLAIGALAFTALMFGLEIHARLHAGAGLRWQDALRWVAVVVLPLLAIIGIRWADPRARIRALRARLPSWPPAIAVAFALGFTLLELLPSIQTTTTLPGAFDHTRYHLPYVYGEFAALVNGRVSGVDFFPQYQNLLPTLAAPYFRAVGLSVGSFSALMVVLSLVGFLSVFGALRIVTGGAWRALGLYLPFVALSVSPFFTDGAQYVGPYTYPPVGPLRYWLAFVALYCLIRYTARPSARGLLAVALITSFGALNCLDFGTAAYLAAGATIGLTSGRPLRTAATFATSLLAVFAFWSVATWMVSGSFIAPSALGQFQRAFAVNGFGMLPIDWLGWHWLVYATLMGAVLTGLSDLAADYKAVRRSPLTALLLFSGIFGFGAGMYFVGRSHPHALCSLYSAFALALGALAWRNFTQDPANRARLRLSTAALGLGLVAAYGLVLSPPSPIAQWHRLRSQDLTLEQSLDRKLALIRRHSPAGSDVEIIYPHGFALAVRAGVANRFPFALEGSLILRSQIDQTLAPIDARGIRQVYGILADELKTGLSVRGFSKVAADDGGFEVWVRE